jgi:hypothetical protein
MDSNEWSSREPLPGGKSIAYNYRTRRWYLYNKRGVLITSNRDKKVLLAWREGE